MMLIESDLGVAQDMSLPSSDPQWGLVGFPWFFSIHSAEVNSDISFAEQALQEVIALGGVGVRTDVMWHEIEPQQGVNDQDSLRFYKSYFRRAHELGLKPLLIFSSPPSWAVQLYRSGDRALFWTAVESYVTLATLLVREYTDHYQLWNDANHVIDPIDETDHGELIRRIGRIVRMYDPEAMLSVNVMANISGWESSVTQWVQSAGDVIDVIGVDHFPGTWTGFDFTDWGPVETLARRINDPSDLWYGKQGALMETGYSSWGALVVDEGRQAEWIVASLTALRQSVSRHNSTHENKLILGNYYQLIDFDGIEIPQEAHFGILRSDLSRKEGYSTLRQVLSEF